MANETNTTKQIKNKKKNSELFQLLLSVFVIGVFIMIEVWLIFFYCSRYGYDSSTFLFPFIFGILTILMVCINTLNIYQIFVKRVSGGGSSDKKAEYMIYKQVKSLPDSFQLQLDELNAEFEKTQKKTAKAIWLKIDEQFNQMKEELAAQGNSESAESANEITKQLEAIRADVDGMKTQISELKDASENIHNMLRVSSSDHDKIIESFPVLQNEHNKVFELLGSLTFRNDEVKSMLDNLTQIEQDSISERAAESQIYQTQMQDSTVTEGEGAQNVTDVPEQQPADEEVAVSGSVEAAGVEDTQIDDLFEETEPTVENDLFTETEPTVENDLFTETEPTVENDLFTETEPTVENDLFEETEPSVENDLFVAQEPEAEQSAQPQINIPEISGDPNKQLSPDEIAALFANV